MKKIISLIMIVVLCIDNSVFAFAQDKITTEEKSTEVDCQDIYEDGGFESDVEPYADYFNGLEKQPKVYVTSENRECEVCADLNEFTKWGIVNGVNKVLVDCSKREIVYKLEFENFTDEITVKRNDSEILDMVVRQGEIQNNIQVKKISA
ncbi:MAG: hypothetical protein E7280_04195 [Lachnospiraceae bacterium]|nr:hypothetical protein [Lachnospiraceae bacterium]